MQHSCNVEFQSVMISSQQRRCSELTNAQLSAVKLLKYEKERSVRGIGLATFFAKIDSERF